jgi:hypothetical protein
MKPTYEFCSNCKSVTQHLNGYCSCVEIPKEIKSKIIKVEKYNGSPDVINSISKLIKIYEGKET